MSQYIDRKTAEASYRPKAGSMSPGLKRAREPYLVRNALTGLALGALAVGIWAWSISAVKQDMFDDVDEEAKELMKSREKAGAAGVGAGTTGVVTVGLAEPRKDELEVVVETLGPTSLAVSSLTFTAAASNRRGLFQRLDGRFPRLLDPNTKTLVWGAPPVDHLGSMWDRSS